MSLLVIKFGGNVLASAAGIQETLEIIQTQYEIWDSMVVVTSALVGVTDQLYEIAQTAAYSDEKTLRGQIAELRRLHIAAAQRAVQDPDRRANLLSALDSLFFDLIEDCAEVQKQRAADPAQVDQIVAMGERLVVRIVAAAGREAEMDCVPLDGNHLIITDDRHSNARPNTPLSKQHIEQNLVPLLGRGFVPVVTGYIGANEKGAITTLGRGGSDYSATYLAAILGAMEVWFFTDVEGLMSADPAVVPGAQVLPTSSYHEVAEMARFGARVLHPLAIEPLVQQQIPLRIRSLHLPNSSGTYIYDHTDTQTQRLHAITQALAVRVVGPRGSNMTEVCSRLVLRWLNDEIQPSLQVENNAGNMVIYVAPTSVNQERFYKFIDQLQQYESGDMWDVEVVNVLAFIGPLSIADHIRILDVLNDANIVPVAFAQGVGGAFLVAVPPTAAQVAIQHAHQLIAS
ncbi:MAG: aspartate kinase [Anaerolineales bacterium]